MAIAPKSRTFRTSAEEVAEARPSTSEEGKPSWLKIGFNQAGKRVVMDIAVWNVPYKYSQVAEVLIVGMPHRHPSFECTNTRQYRKISAPSLPTRLCAG